MSSQPETTKKRIIFMGTPAFANQTLMSLATDPDFEIVGVFTQADKPVGRGRILTPPPIKTLAESQNLKIFQPQKIKTEIETIKNLKPDLIVIVAYGQIIPQEILDIPPFGCLNVHASLLPKYRGASCLNAPIINGDQETGITIMKIDAGLDTGPILRQAKIQLTGQETLENLHDKLALLGAEILPETIKSFIKGDIKPRAQDNSQASYVGTIKKSDGKIDWRLPANKIERLIRAYNPWPGTYAKSGEKTIKIIAVSNQIINSNNHLIGELFFLDDKLAVQCGQDSLVILKLQAEGKKIMTSQEFWRGHKLSHLT